MSSSPPTDVPPIHRPARWRSPAGWSLRARLVAVMIVLLAVLGLVVGATAEVYLHKTLYDRFDAQLADVSDRSFQGRPRLGGTLDDRPPPGASAGWIVLQIATTSDGVSRASGGRVFIQQADDEYAPRYAYDTDIPLSAVAELAGLPADGERSDVDLGHGLGEYRVISTPRPDGSVTVTAAPLAETK